MSLMWLITGQGDQIKYNKELTSKEQTKVIHYENKKT